MIFDVKAMNNMFVGRSKKWKNGKYDKVNKTLKITTVEDYSVTREEIMICLRS